MERHLYGYTADPELSLPDLAPRLDWLPSRLAAAEHSHHDFEMMLNTVLVFAGARTSTIGGHGQLDLTRSLVADLNSTLTSDEYPQFAIEIVFKGPEPFCVTRSQSPRFDWSLRLTHLQVGRNLDYFAAGHIDQKGGTRAIMDFIERETVSQLWGEMAPCDLIDHIEFYEAWCSFSNRREEIINGALCELGLKYRVSWSLLSPKQTEMMQLVMQNPKPPSDDWWHRNWNLVNFPPPYDRSSFYLIARPATRFRVHWEFLQFVYNFYAKYSCDDLSWNPDFKQFEPRFDQVFQEDIAGNLVRDMDSEESSKFYENSKSKLQDLAVIAEKFSRSAISPRSVSSTSTWVWIWRRLCWFPWCLRHWVWFVTEGLKIHLFQRWKLRKPRIHPRPPLPAHSDGNKYWWSDAL
jgi:hypothetical protein